MDEAAVILNARAYVKQLLAGDKGGHDWWHIHRVVQTALKIAETEGGSLFTIELAALYHDLADWKLHDDPQVGLWKIRDWLVEQGVDADIVDEVIFIAEHISYKGGTNNVPMHTLEGKIVQDADLLDGIGAIGIARTFTYGGSIGRPLYDPSIPPRIGVSFAEYRDRMHQNTTLNYFYEKLLHGRDLMNTVTGRAMADALHTIMTRFLEDFLAQWSGE